jgi:hypothetical protein
MSRNTAVRVNNERRRKATEIGKSSRDIEI